MASVRSSVIRRTIAQLTRRDGARLVSVWGSDERHRTGGFCVRYLLSIPGVPEYVGFAVDLQKPALPSIAGLVPSAQPFEREIEDLLGLSVTGLPAERSLLPEGWPSRTYPLRRAGQPGLPSAPDATEAWQGSGTPDDVQEIPIGPVSAWLDGAESVRLQALGETIIDMDSGRLYGHRGAERLFERLGTTHGTTLAESVAGDVAFSHSLAFCQAVEQLSHVIVPPRAGAIRVVLAELERIAVHVRDAARMLSEVGFEIGAALATRLTERLLCLGDAVAAHRHLRHVNVVGGVARDVDLRPDGDLAGALDATLSGVGELKRLIFRTPSVLSRLEGTGCLDGAVAVELGLVGPMARSSGVDVDTRRDHAYAGYPNVFFEVPRRSEADVMARLRVRLEEIEQSNSMIRQILDDPPMGPIRRATGPASPRTFGLAAVESPRGELVYWVQTGDDGGIDRCAIRAPSFINWPALSHAVHGEALQDFSLIQQSLGLSRAEADR